MAESKSKQGKKKIIRPNPAKAQSFAQAHAEVMKKYASVFAKLAK